jgi:GT2 family glycosyltransferase
LHVMVGLPWEQHVAFLDDRSKSRCIEQRVREGVRACAAHPAVLTYAIGNEIPAPIVRWHGKRRIERFLGRLYSAAKEEDPHSLVTYVTYPSTEYLELAWFDLVCFNVYLEEQPQLEAYLARLHNLAGDRPLLIAELGLDSQRKGAETQARTLAWQLRSAFASGCAGAFVFSWTDEWHRGGFDIDDWDFGLTDRKRRPKPALESVRQAFAEVPFDPAADWPRVSVVVCGYNGAETLRDCFDGLRELDYPDFEVIVVDDGSTDATKAIAEEYGFRVISTPNRGLSSARNTGIEAADAEIVAFLDADARPDPHWLKYLAFTLATSEHVGVGGPNIAPAGDGLIADCVANAPGGPVHVLRTDREAEHIPGCNMAFRKESLEAVGGFDPQFRAAGDDVDLCWRLLESGRTIGFHPGALVWHHRRNSLRAYLRQQRGYGRAEALLERKWPEKYSAAGHFAWTGRLYGQGVARGLRRGRKPRHGTWGTRLFQSLYEPGPSTLGSLPAMPEWQMLVAALAALSLLGLLWAPLLLALPLALAALGATLVQAVIGARQAPRRRSLTALLHFLQPIARMQGRVQGGLTPWRRRGVRQLAVARPRTTTEWSEEQQWGRERLEAVEKRLRDQRVPVRRGGEYDRWDLEVRGGLLGSARMRMAVEEHDGGAQLVRVRSWPRCSIKGVLMTLALAALSAGAAVGSAWVAAGILAVVAVALAARALIECAGATADIVEAIEDRRAGSTAPAVREAEVSEA